MDPRNPWPNEKAEDQSQIVSQTRAIYEMPSSGWHLLQRILASPRYLIVPLTLAAEFDHSPDLASVASSFVAILSIIL